MKKPKKEEPPQEPPKMEVNELGEDSIFEIVAVEGAKPTIRVKPEAVQRVDRETLEGMGKLNRMRLTHANSDSLTLRQLQSAGAEFIASFVGHPEFRKRTIEEGLKDPLSILKIASSERPKEIHLEAEVQHSVVVVPTQLSPEAWDEQIKTLEGEVVKEDKW